MTTRLRDLGGRGKTRALKVEAPAHSSSAGSTFWRTTASYTSRARFCSTTRASWGTPHERFAPGGLGGAAATSSSDLPESPSGGSSSDDWKSEGESTATAPEYSAKPATVAPPGSG